MMKMKKNMINIQLFADPPEIKTVDDLDNDTGDKKDPVEDDNKPNELEERIKQLEAELEEANKRAKDNEDKYNKALVENNRIYQRLTNQVENKDDTDLTDELIKEILK